jgi:TonB family protein
MSGVSIYRPPSCRLTWAAFARSIVLYIGAIALAENKSLPVAVEVGSEASDVIGLESPSEASPQPEEVLPSDQIPQPTDQEMFSEEAVPRPIRLRKRAPVVPMVHSIGVGWSMAPHAGSVKALTLYAPRPSYPYEARRSRVTGSGVAELNVNLQSGDVINARMLQSTGSRILDNATIETLRRWRFKPGVAERISVPITFTLTGVSY